MPLLLGRRCASVLLSVVAFGLATLPATAQAYCRTTTKPLPPTYSPSRGCYTQGLFLFWRNACVSYSVNKNGSKTIPFEDATRVIDAAFQTWMNAKCSDSGAAPGITTSDLGAATCGEVRYNGDAPNQNLIVFRDDGWPYSDPNSTLGLTTVTFNAETGEIFDADMEINSSGRNLSITDRVPAQGFDLASVITHEAGHFLGLAHATDSRSTMYASYKPGTIELRTLAKDDIDGLCAIYPSVEQRTVSQAVSANGTVLAEGCNPSPRHGFSSQCGGSGSNKDDGPCSVSAPGSSSAVGGSAGVALVVAGMVISRRRRRA